MKRIYLILAMLSIAYLSVIAHEGHQHDDEQVLKGSAFENTPTIASVNRDLRTSTGHFVITVWYSPSDPRAGESANFLVRILEKVEGGFGEGGTLPISNASVIAMMNESDKKQAVHISDGDYKFSLTFESAGDFILKIRVITEDNRQFDFEFPIKVVANPIQKPFQLGLTFTIFLSLVAFWLVKRNQSLPIGILVSLSVFILNCLALAYFIPMKEVRATPEISADMLESSMTAQMFNISKESQILLGIKTQPVSIKNVTNKLKTAGIVRVKPDAKASITSSISGKLFLGERVTLGTVVRKGEVLGYVEQILDANSQLGLQSQTLDLNVRKIEFQSKILELRAQAAEQSLRLQQARARLEQASRELKRSESLVEIGAIPVKRLEEAKLSFVLAQKDVEASEKQLESLNTQIDQFQKGQSAFKNLQTPSLRVPLICPITGIIENVNMTNGVIVEPGKEILSVVNISTVLLEAKVFENDLPTVREATGADFSAFNGSLKGRAKIVFIGQTVDASARTIPVLFEIMNPLNQLRDGMYVDVLINTDKPRSVLTVPKSAIVMEQGRPYVFVFHGGEIFERRLISLGEEGTDYFEVKAGLQEEERVAVEGLYQLRSIQAEL